MNAFLPEEDIQQDINFNEQESKHQINKTRNEIKIKSEVLNYYIKIIYHLLEYKENIDMEEEVYQIVIKDFIAIFNNHFEMTIILIRNLRNLIKKDERYSLEMPEATEVIIRVMEKDYFKDLKLYYKFYKQNLFDKNDFLMNNLGLMKSLIDYDIFIKILEMYDE